PIGLPARICWHFPMFPELKCHSDGANEMQKIHDSIQGPFRVSAKFFPLVFLMRYKYGSLVASRHMSDHHFMGSVISYNLSWHPSAWDQSIREDNLGEAS